MNAENHRSLNIPDNVSKRHHLMASLWLLACLSLLPDIALANPIEDGLDWVVDLLTNGLARSAAILGIVALGYFAWAGRITAAQCGLWVLGIVFVFGGATLVDLLSAVVA
ncbi:hypothetical protein GCM10011348_28410 [Marinobacterium nitratireducens]|uniref:Type IV secretion system protein VirB2 n=1 Tax=Marinobacterium nitratireducens TaxID=518897 RepID=A0A917ZIE6_9GAMM|nr:TrbC/VirB2 family protein [Marinobacterium nitratireducens]GGO83793.1 hypothetical protein GCM10011348_28410 [Marinobacterium nitratireducens]